MDMMRRIVFMIHYKCGDIVLLEYPFSDFGSLKKRPALIIHDTGDDDVILARITSQLYDSEYDVYIQNWKNSNLLVPSVVRCHKIASLQKNIIERKLGILDRIDFDNFKEIFNKFIKIK